MPAIRESIEQKKWKLADEGIVEVGKVLNAEASLVNQAARTWEGSRVGLGLRRSEGAAREEKQILRSAQDDMLWGWPCPPTPRKTEKVAHSRDDMSSRAKRRICI